MADLAIRFIIGGLVVSVFSLISDIFKPKTFAGLFGAAPSVALASLGLTVLHDGRAVASVEARSMIIGAIALLIYAASLSWLVLRFRLPSFPVFLPGLLLWLGVAVGLWYAFLV
jgi:ABC-type xylose transport system permease subunit